MKKRSIWWIIGIGVLVAVALPVLLKGKWPEFRLETDSVKRQTLFRTITATGTIHAKDQVEVGTQVSGVVAGVYADYNSPVTKGQVIARLDTRTLKASVQESQASFRTAEVLYKQAERTYNRAKVLYEQKVYSQVEYENALAEYEQAEASYENAKVKLYRDQVNLQYATITSPMDGVVIGKSVEAGQTVAASFNTPTLFTIASDLTQMEIEASIDEADIGQVKTGQAVRFTVDAYPDETFTGKVQQVRLQPQENQNVITYPVIIGVTNPEQKLMPGMTANLTVVIQEKQQVLSVPNAALGFQPDAPIREMLQMEGIKVQSAKSSGNTPTVWVRRADALVQVPVTKGFRNDVRTEISGIIREGDVVVTSLDAETARQTSSRSPFLPTPPSGNQRNKENN